MRNRYRINSPDGAIFPKISDCIKELEKHPTRYHGHIKVYCGSQYRCSYYIVHLGHGRNKTVKEIEEQ